MAERVGVVTGATRGAGKAIALELGAAGWTVYVTGRSTRARPSMEGLPGTLEETSEAVDAVGGRGIPVRCDHTSLPEIESLVSGVRSGSGRLDLLVNNAWGGYEAYDYEAFGRPFWEQAVEQWDRMFTAGVRSTLLTSARFALLFLDGSRGLIVNTIAWLHGDYMGNLFYDTAKAAIARMTFGMAKELRPRGVSAVALAPGFMRTERVMASHAKEPFDLSATESPVYLARAVRALATDPAVAKRSGEILYVGDLAKEYGFTDANGRQPPPFRIPPSGREEPL
jgi:NAD(P)-dependent dehydrogenase (short-subunit alcohol dehydrogenase family)